MPLGRESEELPNIAENTENTTLVDNGWTNNIAPKTKTKKRRNFWKKQSEFTNVIELPGAVKVNHSSKSYDYLNNVFYHL